MIVNTRLILVVFLRTIAMAGANARCNYFCILKVWHSKSAILDQCQQLATLYSNIQKLKWSDWNIDIQFYNTQNGFGLEKTVLRKLTGQISRPFELKDQIGRPSLVGFGLKVDGHFESSKNGRNFYLSLSQKRFLFWLDQFDRPFSHSFKVAWTAQFQP